MISSFYPTGSGGLVQFFIVGGAEVMQITSERVRSRDICWLKSAYSSAGPKCSVMVCFGKIIAIGYR